MRYVNLKSTWPPLSIWLWFLILGTIWGVVLLRWAQYRYDAGRVPAAKVFQQRMTGLRQAWQQDTTPVKVLVLGHSLVRAGIEPPDFFRTRSDSQLVVYKVWVKGGRLDQFVKLYPFFDSALELAPDILLIDEHLLSWQHQPDQRKLGDYFSTFSRQLRGSLLADNWQGGQRVDAHERQSFDHFHPQQHKTAPEGLKTPEIQRSIRSWAQDSLVRPKLHALQARGTRIFQLQLPRPPGHQLPDHPAFEQRTNRLAAELAISYLPFEEALPATAFRDHAHLNTAGCLRYSSWLADTLLQLTGQ
ncbi:MAG: hypothetical protein KDC44_20060 [Phaeodactylibacter sp.]|nr:hypothetical protein [Phaeodactylibacter sp.]